MYVGCVRFVATASNNQQIMTDWNVQRWMKKNPRGMFASAFLPIFMNNFMIYYFFRWKIV